VKPSGKIDPSYAGTIPERSRNDLLRSGTIGTVFSSSFLGPASGNSRLTPALDM